MLYPVGDDSVSGIVRFSLVAGGIKIVADVRGLEPGRHGFHIHEFGDCSAADAASGGGHFNPENMPHGSPTAAGRHAGDLGNIEADISGKAGPRVACGFIAITREE